MSARMSMLASSSGVSASRPPPPAPLPSPCPSRAWSCSSRQNSSACSSLGLTMLYCEPRSEKYTSKMVSNTRQCEEFFTSVAPRAYLNASRSSIGITLTASMASRFSVRLTGRPARRNSATKPDIRSMTGMRRYSSTDSSLAALAMSVWYLSSTWSVSLACCASM